MSASTDHGAWLTLSRPAPAALQAKSDAARQNFTARGLPTRRDETWRHTSLEALKERTWALADDKPADLDNAWLEKHLGAATTPRAVFINGRYDAGLSTRAVTTLDKATWSPELFDQVAPNESLVALNTSFASGAAVELGNEALELVWVTLGDNVMSQPRVLVRVAKNAHAKLALRFVGSDTSHWVNAVSEVLVADDASLTMTVASVTGGSTTGGSQHALFTQCVAARLQGNSKLHLTGASSALRLAHTSVHLVLGEGSDVDVGFVHLGDDEANLATALTVQHEGRSSTSQQTLRALSSGSAVSTFDSLVRVVRGAKGSNSNQDSRALLLSKSAAANHKPQLEIHDDDVKCAHGSTTGQLDETALFYMRSRGIPLQQARALLSAAFVEPVLARFGDDPLRTRLQSILEAVVADAPDAGLDKQ